MILHRPCYPENGTFSDLPSSWQVSYHSYWKHSFSKRDEENITYFASLARSVSFVARAERRPSGCTFPARRSTFWHLGGRVSAAVSLFSAAF